MRGTQAICTVISPPRAASTKTTRMNPIARLTRPFNTVARGMSSRGKYTFFTDPCHLAAGLILELPTGDEDLGPGQGELHFDAFAAVRYPLESHNIDLIGNAGFRYNADAKWGDHELEGEMAFRVGGGALFGITEQIDVSGEFLFQTENYKDAEEEIWLLAGGHFAITEAWKVRAGLQLGLSDAAPDFGIIAGVVYQF